MRGHTRRALVASLLALSFSGRAALAQTRPATWARPINLVGAPNLHAVAPGVFRSAQPTAAGFRALAEQHGIKTVVSMRANHADDWLARGTGIKVVPFPTNTWHIRRASVVGALRTLRAASPDAPVLLHCQHGADRTGLIMALYRILYQGWTKEAALDEMRNGGFGYHAVWGNIPRFIRRVDVARLRAEVDAP
jgi:protein tyrosine/serine phosphatase